MKISIKRAFFYITALCFSIQANAESNIQKNLSDLEKSAHGRLGISAIDTNNNYQIEYKDNERFAFCSVNKVIGVSAILKQNMKDKNLLQQKIKYQKKDIVDYSPITEKNAAREMTISELCAAAIKYSDNTAINLLMKKLGGLDAVNRFARSIGDNQFRIDRWEPELSTAIPGDIRDTTTPLAMTTSFQKLTYGDVLAAPQHDLLITWLLENTTGNERIRAGVPKNWSVGDKTGTGEYGTTNDVAIIWPTNCKPIIMTIFFTQPIKSAKKRNDVLAKAAHLLIQEFSLHDPCIK
jgi:beta-lactamase class A